VNAGQVATGAGLAVFGAAFIFAARLYVAHDGLMRRTAASRLRIERHLNWRLRRGRITEDEWSDRFIHGQRALVKWAFTPFMALWLILCLITIGKGLGI
jgi:hypothetical protein